MKKPILLLLITTLLFSACGNKLPEGVIEPTTMKSIMWDMMVAEQVHKMDTSKDSRLHLKDSAITSFSEILSIYKISEKNYKKSLQYYEAHPDLINDLFDSIGTYAKRLNDSIKPAVGKKKLLPVDSLPIHSKLDSNTHKIKLPQKHFLKQETKTLKSL